LSDLDIEELAVELAEFAPPEKKGGRSAREERVIAGFEDIQRFVDEHGRAPQHGEDRDILERLFAVRLDRIRTQPQCRALLDVLDRQGLLNGDVILLDKSDEVDHEALLRELEEAQGEEHIATLRHVRSSEERRQAEEIAERVPCADFETFRLFFERLKRDIASGIRQAKPIQTKRQGAIKQGEWFVVGGQTAYVAEAGEEFLTEYNRRDSRLRVIYDNGTESNILSRSFQRALHRDPSGRLISDPVAGPLFTDVLESGDVAAGTIYVLRSKSGHPTVAENRDVLHKIGVTGSDVKRRIADAKNDPTFLMAEVEIVATYELYNISRAKLENLIHRVFAPAQVEIEIKDRFGKPVVPREWFLVPLFVVDEVVERIKGGTITEYVYDPKAASLIPVDR
jgi:T5orf172 domain